MAPKKGTAVNLKISAEAPTEAPEEADGAEIEYEDDDEQIVPLFAPGELPEEVTTIAIERLEPSVGEGFIGSTDPGASAADIKARHGGGRYHVIAKNGQGVIRKHAYLTIAGDPKFESKTARRKYKQQIEAELAEDAPPVAQFGGLEPMQFLQMQMTQQRDDAERRERRDIDERRQRDKEAQDREDRRRHEDEDRDRQRQRDAEAQRDRDREHTTGMIQMIQASHAQQERPASDLPTFIEGIKLAMSMDTGGGGGDDKDDPYGLKASMPDIVDRILGGKENPDAGEQEDGSIKLTGTTADHLRNFVTKARAAGIDPEKLLTAQMDDTVRKLAKSQKNKRQKGARKVGAAVDARKDSKEETRKPAAKKRAKKARGKR